MAVANILGQQLTLFTLFFTARCQEHITIVAPERQTVANDIQSAIEGGERATMYSVTASVFYIDKNNPTPNQTIEVFCDNVFKQNSSVILSINYETETSRATEYITNIASRLGYPVISWDPFFQGALEADDDKMLLQLSPTIYHECKAMVLIMERYNWTEFTIVTSEDMGLDFIDCMDLMVKRTSIVQGYLSKPRYTKIATVILPKQRVAYFDDWEIADTKKSFQELIRAKSRIVLLHAIKEHAANIIDVAKDMGLVDQQYAWVLTSTSVGDISISTGTGLPAGMLGVSQNRSIEKVTEAIVTTSRLVAEAAKTLMTLEPLNPDLSCNTLQSPFSRWQTGMELYLAMKSTNLRPSSEANAGRGRGSGRFSSRRQTNNNDPQTRYPVSFTENGVVENEELFLVNVRPPKEQGTSSRRRFVLNQWDTVGRIYPKVENRETVLTIETNEIIWPGLSASPPIGRPEKRFFRIVTKEEEPFVNFVAPDEITGQCGHHAVPCFVNSHHLKKKNLTDADITNGTVDYCCTGFCIEVLQTLAEKMNFEFVIYEVPDGQWGIPDENGTWNGLVKEILDDKADMILTAFVINKVRNTAIDLSSPFLESGITIMVSIRKGAISPYAFLEPYDFYSWILILIFSVHATGASIFIFEWLSPSGLDQGKTSTVEHKFSLFRSFWLIWAMLFGAAVSIDVPRGGSSRFLANVWALFALVFLASYTANLAAFMITIDEYYNLSGIEDWRLLHPTKLTPHFKFSTIRNSSTDVNLQITYPRMHKYMTKYSQPDVSTAKQNLKNHSIHAFIYDANVLEFVAGRDEDCALLTVGRWYAMSGYGVGVKRGSPLREEVNEIILNMQHAGEIERMQAFWLSGACHAKKDKKNKKSNKIGILNFISAFILLAAGVLLGVILLILEHLYFKSGRKCLKKYDKCGCCALVSLSMGKSLTFEQSVMEAIDIQRKHKCKDPICEMNVWQARHSLDMALLKLKHMQSDLDAALENRAAAADGDSAAEASCPKALAFDIGENETVIS
ncbi:glutamate receptor ionotropic, NMDA 2B-like [Mya arenaria]|uniref:glutamate receptor ionotropic, NMDA 2B-like n=1 Tax=Mya arenaria TaxID=6604 RepID=UPI0022E2DAFB|nr:glutamate receptor ionotropic, NMDA 2B-like [Mya arenaria]XP_052800897.1 glutamate receptor ionotropic, NMDA 2B-like [Mya arenaria]